MQSTMAWTTSTYTQGLTSPKILIPLGFCLTLPLCWRYLKNPGGRRPVPARVEREVSQTLRADPYTELEVGDEGELRLARNTRHGVALRLALEVKHEMGGITPSYTDANRMVVTRRIDDVMTAHGVTRRIDRALMAPKIRALVFTRLAGEREEAQWVNSQAAQSSHNDVRGWGAYVMGVGAWFKTWSSRSPSGAQ